MTRLITFALSLTALVTLALHPLASAAVHAQVPPTRFYGALTIDGQPAPAGAAVQAFVGDLDCTAAVDIDMGEGRYVVDVQHFATIEGCGIEDAEVRFAVNGYTAGPNGTFLPGSFVELDLNVSTTDAPSAPPPAPESQPSPEPAPAPEAESAPEPAPEGGEPSTPPTEEAPPSE